jgi:hypothetical protein
MLVVHEHGDMNKIQFRQQVQQGLPKVEDGNLTSGTGVEPFSGNFYWHGITSLMVWAMVLKVLGPKGS